MASNNLLHEIDDPSPVVDELAPKVVEQLKDILEEAERVGSTEDSGKAFWQYSVPMAGVRYYGFQEGPN